MHKKKMLVVLLPLLYLMTIVQAATITTSILDKNVYKQGSTGYLTVTVYNDKDSKIRVTELTATIDYYYEGGNTYIQAFFTSATVPIEILPGQTSDFYVPFSLPTNIAPGYTTFLVRAKTELWNNNSRTWYGSDQPTYRPKLYIESPYKQLFEDEGTENNLLQEQLQELQAVNTTTTNMMYMLAVTTIIFAAVTMVLILLIRKPRVTPQAIP